MQKIKIQKNIYTFSLFFFCLFFMKTGIIYSAVAKTDSKPAHTTSTNTTSADKQTNCAKPGGNSGDGDTAQNDKKVFCFFSLNNEKEFQYVKSASEMEYPRDRMSSKTADGNVKYETEEEFNQRKQMLTEAENNPNVEIVEYYGADSKNQSVEERFKKMMEEKACDSLVLSGHHAEYFTGQQSIGGEDWKLDLNFLEEMSCQPGCKDWFSNVKSLFLMGCNTVEGQLDSTVANRNEQAEDTRCEGGNTADCKATYVAINNATDPNQDKDWNLGVLSQGVLNKAYSSTLDQNTNPLSSRYLKVFRNSSLYGWSHTAPGVGALSRFSIPRFIHMVSGLTGDGKPRERDLSKESGKDEPDIGAQDIVNFLDVMNNQGNMGECRKFTASQWTKHWDAGTAPTSCYLDDDWVDTYKHYEDSACKLNQALNAKPLSTEDVQTAVKRVLGSNSRGIKRNFNHLMNLVVEYKGKTPKPEWYDTIRATLQGSENLQNVLTEALVDDPHIGFTKKADYLYFYKQIYGDSNTEEDQKRHQQVSNAFLTHLNQAYEQVFNLVDNAPDSRKLAPEDKFILVSEYHQLVQTSIVNNGDDGLASWLYSHQEQPEGQENRFDELIKRYKNPNLTKYLADNAVTNDDTQFYSELVKGFCEKLMEPQPEVCKEEADPPPSNISSVITTLPVLSLK